MDCVDTHGGGARSIDCFILFAWQTGDLTWRVSRRSVSDDTRRDCSRWRDTDTSQSSASPGPRSVLADARVEFSGPRSPASAETKRSGKRLRGIRVSKWRKGVRIPSSDLVFEQNKMDALTSRRLITAAYVHHVRMGDKGMRSRGEGLS